MKLDIKFPQYISGKEKTITVSGIISDDTEFIDGKGYINEDGKIWIYSVKKPCAMNLYPYFWFEDGKMQFSNPSENIFKTYNLNNMKDLSLVKIIEKTEVGEELLDDEAMAHVNAGTAFYVPSMKSRDDFLKKLVKTTIIEKNIDINALKGKTEQKYVLANMRSALENSTKMSVKYFMAWMELLGCDFQINITDNNMTTSNKLQTDIEYTSQQDTISVINDKNQKKKIIFE